MTGITLSHNVYIKVSGIKVIHAAFTLSCHALGDTLHDCSIV